jgi:predicted permease
VRQVLLDLPHDLRFALRALRRSPLVTATIVLCLGFSVGATATVFAWTETMILQPVTGVKRLDRLVSLKTLSANGEDDVSYPAYKDVRDWEKQADAKTFEGLAAFVIRRLNLRVDAAADDRRAEPVWAVLASANYFDVLGVQPALGRLIGRPIWIRGKAMTIVGVAPRDFYGTISHLGMDLWIPVTMHPELADNPHLLGQRETRWFAVFARLAPGATLASARASAEATGRRLAASFAADRDVGLTVRVLDVGPAERMAAIFAVMLGIAALVLLIVCSNVANLLLQRGAAREHELAVRLALGARPARIVRQLMTEGALLAAGAVLVGGVVLSAARNALAGIVPPSPLPIVTDTPIDGSVLLVLAGVGAATVFLFALAPAVRAAGVAVRSSLAGGGTRGGSRGGGRVRGALISAQFALSLAVLVAAGLFLSRLNELNQVDRGFRDPTQVMLATVDFEMAQVRGDQAERVLVERMVDRLSALPGVAAAAAASFVPLGFLGYSQVSTSVDGYVPQPGESTTFLANYVSRGYFELMGIPIRRGRGIEASDREGTLPIAVVNEAFAERFWGSSDAVGRHVRVNGRDLTVAGVAGNGKYEFLTPLDAPSPPFVYLPFAQWGHYEAVLHVRTDGDPMAIVPSVERVVSETDGRLSAMSPVTLEAYTAVPLLPVRLATLVLSVLGGAALALAAIGLYAVTAYAVTQQRREIGIRIALGATRGRVVTHFLMHAGGYVLAGAVAGAGLALAVVYLLTTRLPAAVPSAAADRVGPFVAAAAALGAVAVVAVLLPAGHAARVNPTTALRDE